MIIDVHTRVWDSVSQWGEAVTAQLRRWRTAPWHHLDANPEQHDHAMAPVGAAVIHGFESAKLGASIDGESVARYVARAPERLIGFVGIDPTAGSTGDAVKKLQDARDMGLQGVTVSPAAAGFHPTDTRAMMLYEAALDAGLPVMFDSTALLAQSSSLEFAQPVLLDEVAREFPDLKLVLGSLGDPWVDQGVAMLAKHPSVYADLSGLIHRPWQLLSALLTARQHGVTSQLLLGSNFPFGQPERAIVALYSVNGLTHGTQLPSVPREQVRSVVEADALAVLGLSLEAGGGRETLEMQPRSAGALPAPPEGNAEVSDDEGGDAVIEREVVS
jgi:predicted TIM-barrel fold metal-dependent hydrolase